MVISRYFKCEFSSDSKIKICDFNQEDLVSNVNMDGVIVECSNNLKALCETSRLGIPAIVVSNPRNHVTTDASVGLTVGLRKGYRTDFSKSGGRKSIRCG